MPQSSEPIRHEPQNFFRKIAENRRKAQKEHRTPIRPAKMYKKNNYAKKYAKKSTYAAPVCNYQFICPETL